MNAPLGKVVQQVVGVVALVGQHGLRGKSVYQRLRMGDVSDLSPTEQAAQQVTQCIHSCMDFRAQSCARAPQRLIADFF